MLMYHILTCKNHNGSVSHDDLVVVLIEWLNGKPALLVVPMQPEKDHIAWMIKADPAFGGGEYLVWFGKREDRDGLDEIPVLRESISYAHAGAAAEAALVYAISGVKPDNTMPSAYLDSVTG